MLNSEPNMGRKQIFEELPNPSKVPEKELKKYIYKAIFIVVKLVLDIRLNLVKISEGKKIKTKHTSHKIDNPVIPKNREIK